MASEVVLDSSALVAMISGEVGADSLLRRTRDFAAPLVGGPTFLETTMILLTRKGMKRADLPTFLGLIEAKVVAFDDRHAEAAIDAFERFGRGNHPARLNFGDCMSYAVAKVADAPLLYVGDDFGQTDIRPSMGE